MDSRRILLALASAVWMAGCGPKEEDTEAVRPAEFGFQRSIATTLIEEGRTAFRRYCAGCHGPEGDGNGPAGVFFEPKPRNFQEANFKFSSTRSGQLPLDSDLRRTIKRGLKGSAMPPFELLSDRTVDALIAYVKTFSPKWQERTPARAVPLVEDPYRAEPDKSEAIARGELIYHGFATCWTCHPAYAAKEKINRYRRAVGAPAVEGFRDDLNRSVLKPNTRGEIMYPPDFRRDFVRAGWEVGDLYRSIAAGITGTAMPTWVDSMSVPGRSEGGRALVQPSDLWAVAYYVQSLIARRPAKLQEGRITFRERSKTIYLHGPPAAAPVKEPAAEEEPELKEGDFEDEFEG